MTIAEKDTPAPVGSLKSQIPHPLIDSDGHHVEFLPVLEKYFKQAGVEHDLLEMIIKDTMGADSPQWAKLSPEERRARRVMRPSYAEYSPKVIDRATTMLPDLLYARLDEIGLDFAVVYPSLGNFLGVVSDERSRRAACHAFNEYFMDMFRDFRDRIAIPAVIPMHSPEEALEELDHAAELGFNVGLIPSYVRRFTDDPKRPLWFDAYALDSLHDYDPVWARCGELKMPLSAHSAGYGVGWLERQSYSSFSYNHIGHFGVAGELLCRTLLMGGVTRRFPAQRFAFLEGGVGWAAALFCSVISHWEKRNAEAISQHMDAGTDESEFKDLVRRYGGRLLAEAGPDALDQVLWTGRGESEDADDEWEPLGITDKRDFVDRFVTPFFFGAEADDPTTVSAFSKANPFGSRLQVLFSSDIGHFDVPDMLEVLHEAHEGVDEGWMTDDDFRDFTFTNAVNFLTSQNRDFFKGTKVEADVERFLRSGAA